jgi:hypothetical protein
MPSVQRRKIGVSGLEVDGPVRIGVGSGSDRALCSCVQAVWFVFRFGTSPCCRRRTRAGLPVSENCRPRRCRGGRRRRLGLRRWETCCERRLVDDEHSSCERRDERPAGERCVRARGRVRLDIADPCMRSRVRFPLRPPSLPGLMPRGRADCSSGVTTLSQPPRGWRGPGFDPRKRLTSLGAVAFVR